MHMRHSLQKTFSQLVSYQSFFCRYECNQLVFDAEKWLLQAAILDELLVFIPFNTDNTHYFLLFIDMDGKTVTHLDSLVGSSRHDRVESCVDKLVDCFQAKRVFRQGHGRSIIVNLVQNNLTVMIVDGLGYLCVTICNF